MSRRLTKGSHKAAAGVTFRLYKAFYILNGNEVQHERYAMGSNKEEAKLSFEATYGITTTKLKQR